ncbi:MAG: 2-amino-4-hydroxy-6-hydroxymethyldihydropteridine diphosphokinase [Verrucomicrobiota bacterium]|nr:2-amino-4-hydroxy-6-hydroxymethyldihydropteridine diphosphokinase [Verrucomicrobiota bacterium]
MRAGIALGSNLGDRRANLSKARERISRLPMVHSPIVTSSIYETEPVDCPRGSPAFLNAVIEVECDGEPVKFLTSLHEIEDSLGRERSSGHNLPRTLDLDLLYIGNAILAVAALQLPHPRMDERQFVLEPLAEIRPDLVLPGQSETVASLLARLPRTADVVRITSEW